MSNFNTLTEVAESKDSAFFLTRQDGIDVKVKKTTLLEGFAKISDLKNVALTVDEMLNLDLKTGTYIYTNKYVRDVICRWLISDNEKNGYGEYSIQLNNGKWACLSPVEKVSPSMFGAPLSPADCSAQVKKALEFFSYEFFIDGIYGVSGDSIPVREGQVTNSLNGPVTGSAIKAGFIALSAMNPMFDLGSAKYADIQKMILDGAGVAQRGFKGVNVFGLNMEQCRVFNTTVSCYEFENNGEQTGSFINSFTKCYSALSKDGFIINSASETNLFVYNECVATDMSETGFREFGGAGGRDNAYNDCDAEKCGIGFLMKTRNFNIVNPYVEFCDKGIVIDSTGLPNGIQSGSISSPSILGSKNFPGQPDKDTLGIELIGNCRNVILSNPWVVYHAKAIVAPITVNGLTINEPFLENNVEDYDIKTKRYSIRKGNQRSNIIENNPNTGTTYTDVTDLAFVDVADDNKNITIDPTLWLIGREMRVIVQGTSINTGNLTIKAFTGFSFFGQNKKSKFSGDQFVVDIGAVVHIFKQSDTLMYFYVV